MMTPYLWVCSFHSLCEEFLASLWHHLWGFFLLFPPLISQFCQLSLSVSLTLLFPSFYFLCLSPQNCTWCCENINLKFQFVVKYTEFTGRLMLISRIFFFFYVLSTRVEEENIQVLPMCFPSRFVTSSFQMSDATETFCSGYK